MQHSPAMPEILLDFHVCDFELVLHTKNPCFAIKRFVNLPLVLQSTIYKATTLEGNISNYQLLWLSPHLAGMCGWMDRQMDEIVVLVWNQNCLES